MAKKNKIKKDNRTLLYIVCQTVIDIIDSEFSLFIFFYCNKDMRKCENDPWNVAAGCCTELLSLHQLIPQNILHSKLLVLEIYVIDKQSYLLLYRKPNDQECYHITGFHCYMIVTWLLQSPSAGVCSRCMQQVYAVCSPCTVCRLSTRTTDGQQFH